MGEWTSADTAAVAQVASSAINYASAASANSKGRKWADKMYERQRADALTDWNMQNEYNSPAAQMARLKAGGLNPNLVYGDGANSPSANIRSSDASWKPEAPRMDLSGAANSLLQSASIRNTEQQTDNLKTQQRLLDQQILREAATTLNIGASTSRSQFDLEQIKAKAATDIEFQKANLANVQADTENKQATNLNIKEDTENKRVNRQFTLDENQRKALINNLDLKKGFQEIANMAATNDSIRQGIKNAKTQNAIAELDRALKAMGIQPHDPAYIRLLEKGYELLPTPQRFKAWVDNSVKAMWNRAKQKASGFRQNLIP